MRLPTWDELVDKQKEILEHPLDEPLFVAGPPGSGKTVLAVSRARMLADNNKSVVLVTFNRMLRRLASQLDAAAGHVATMHSFVWKDYLRRTGASPVTPDPSDSYSYDWPAMIANLASHPNAAPTWQHLIVDEGQDLAAGFFEYAFKHVAGAMTVFADDDQSLESRRTTLEEIKAAAHLPDPVILKENHRNCPEVAAVAEHFHAGRLPAAMVIRASITEKPRLIRSSGLAETAELIANWLKTRGGTVGVVVDRNNTGSALFAELQVALPGRRVDFYKNGTDEDMIDLLSAGVTVLNKKSVKGQEFDALFVLELDRLVPCASDVSKRVMYMLCSRARDQLFLVYGPTPLSPDGMAALPEPDKLERS